jgi:hypothetical protein
MASKYPDQAAFDDSPFETIFRYNISWTSIMVKPIVKLAGMIEYKVRMMDGSLLGLFKNDEGKWEESDGGTTPRSAILGNAIDTYYLI